MQKIKLENSINFLKTLYQYLNGDAEYQHYLEHWQLHHVLNQSEPLTRKQFFSDQTRRKWNGIKRCC